MHYQINPFNKFVKGHVADRVQDSCNKGFKFVMCNLFIKLIPCDVDSSDGAVTGKRGFKTDGAHTMNTNYSSENSKEDLKFYIILCP